MIVRFVSSKTGEIFMFADTARWLLTAMGKECTSRGTFICDEMLPAAAALLRAVEVDEAMKAVEAAEKPENTEEAGMADGIVDPSEVDEKEETETETSEAEEVKSEAPVAFRSRAWPLIDMLERTAKSGAKANIVWQAVSDF